MDRTATLYPPTSGQSVKPIGNRSRCSGRPLASADRNDTIVHPPGPPPSGHPAARPTWDASIPKPGTGGRSVLRRRRSRTRGCCTGPCQPHCDHRRNHSCHRPTIDRTSRLAPTARCGQSVVRPRHHPATTKPPEVALDSDLSSVFEFRILRVFSMPFGKNR